MLIFPTGFEEDGDGGRYYYLDFDKDPVKRMSFTNTYTYSAPTHNTTTIVISGDNKPAEQNPNTGAPDVIGVVSAAAIGVMIYYVLKKDCSKLMKIALALMIGGAAGNLFDRLFLGYVRDFLDFIIFGYDFPIFNIADSALTIGVILLFIVSMKEEKKNV